ncbi:MAG: RNA polymerase sigma factor [Phycisphaerales bacterium]|nr:RNA polymerase sigma factor [Phycisphaerales bacterium]
MADRQHELLRLLETDGPRLHALLVRLTLRSDVAEELMQDLFVKLGCSDGFLQSRNPAAYACQAAINLAFNWRRSQKRRREEAGLLSGVPAPNLEPLAQIIHEERLQHLLDALADLPDSSRLLLTMRYIDGQSYDQIAAHFARTAHQARALCHKAVRELRQSLEKESRHAES